MGSAWLQSPYSIVAKRHQVNFTFLAPFFLKKKSSAQELPGLLNFTFSSWRCYLNIPTLRAEEALGRCLPHLPMKDKASCKTGGPGRPPTPTAASLTWGRDPTRGRSRHRAEKRGLTHSPGLAPPLLLWRLKAPRPNPLPISLSGPLWSSCPALKPSLTVTWASIPSSDPWAPGADPALPAACTPPRVWTLGSLVKKVRGYPTTTQA